MKTRKRGKVFALCLLIALLCMPPHGFATVSSITADTIPQAQGAMPATLRILLSRLGLTTQADIEISGTYAMTFGGLTTLFPDQSMITVLLIGGSLYVDYAGMRLGSGSELTLTRYQNETGGENGLRFAGSTALYEGSLWLTATDGVIRPVLTIGVEDYLQGVVPYEMSDSFPLEALKAQTIAARTYAVRKALMNTTGDYDLADTTNDQVYRGRQYYNTNAEAAILATEGVCALYNGSLAMCYYGSSNGGQTELVENQWGAGDETGYLDMRDDPYDLANPKSIVKTAVLPKAASATADTPYGLRQLIADTLRDTLLAQGYDPAGESLRIDTITAVSVDTPAFAAPSRLYTAFYITFTYSARTRTDPPVVTASPAASALSDKIEVSLFTAAPAQAIQTAQADAPAPTIAETPAPNATPQPVYGAFEPAPSPVTLSFPIFPDAESALSLSINVYENELWTVTETDDAFVVEARRFGHGVGMSQYGAQWMASQFGMVYTDILAFYYPGVTLMRFADSAPALPHIADVFTKQADPAPTATPRPTLMPVTLEAGDGQWFATVANIGENSWLNLRAEPNLSADILMLLFKDQRMLVLERMPQEGWVHVKTDVTEGYVMEEYLQAE